MRATDVHAFESLHLICVKLLFITGGRRKGRKGRRSSSFEPGSLDQHIQRLYSRLHRQTRNRSTYSMCGARRFKVPSCLPWSIDPSLSEKKKERKTLTILAKEMSPQLDVR